MTYRFPKNYTKPEHLILYRQHHCKLYCLWRSTYSSPLSVLVHTLLPHHLHNQNHPLICTAGLFNTRSKSRITQLHGNITATLHVNLCPTWPEHSSWAASHYTPTCSNAFLCSSTHRTSSFKVFNATSRLRLICCTFLHSDVKLSPKNPPLSTLKVPSDREYVFHIPEPIKHRVTRPADFAWWAGKIEIFCLPNVCGKNGLRLPMRKRSFLPFIQILHCLLLLLLLYHSLNNLF